MRAQCFYERGKSAQSCPASGRERAASRTMVPPILLTQNRHPHRRWPGRFAVLDPTRSLPGAASCLSGSGGGDDTCAAYRRALGRTRLERRSGRNPADQSRTGGCPCRTGWPRRLRVVSGRCPRIPLCLSHARKGGSRAKVGRGKGKKGLRQDQRNGAMPCGLHAITHCLHILFSCLRLGAISGSMAPGRSQHADLLGYSMAPWRSTVIACWSSDHGRR